MDVPEQCLPQSLLDDATSLLICTLQGKVAAMVQQENQVCLAHKGPDVFQKIVHTAIGDGQAATSCLPFTAKLHPDRDQRKVLKMQLQCSLHSRGNVLSCRNYFVAIGMCSIVKIGEKYRFLAHPQPPCRIVCTFARIPERCY